MMRDVTEPQIEFFPVPHTVRSTARYREPFAPWDRRKTTSEAEVGEIVSQKGSEPMHALPISGVFIVSHLPGPRAIDTRSLG